MSENELDNVINNNLGIINNWFNMNKLSLNSNKTEAMGFHTKQKRIRTLKLMIEFVKECNYFIYFVKCILLYGNKDTELNLLQCKNRTISDLYYQGISHCN